MRFSFSSLIVAVVAFGATAGAQAAPGRLNNQSNASGINIQGGGVAGIGAPGAGVVGPVSVLGGSGNSPATPSVNSISTPSLVSTMSSMASGQPVVIAVDLGTATTPKLAVYVPTAVGHSLQAAILGTTSLDRANGVMNITSNMVSGGVSQLTATALVTAIQLNVSTPSSQATLTAKSLLSQAIVEQANSGRPASPSLIAAGLAIFSSVQ